MASAMNLSTSCSKTSSIDGITPIKAWLCHEVMAVGTSDNFDWGPQKRKQARVRNLRQTVLVGFVAFVFQLGQGGMHLQSSGMIIEQL